MSHELRLTADGSNTLYIPGMDETYHSLFGALKESMHVFIRNGFYECKKNPMSVLEIGFGTGLNAWLTLIEAEKNKINVSYSSYELFPLKDEIQSLNYSQQAEPAFSEYFQKIHETEWEKMVQISSYFSLCKINKDITAEKLFEKYDLIYFDAFAPSKQPEMWTEEMFIKMYDSLSENGILVTYCAKGDVRRTMQKVGFTVEKLPGPPGGKREMLRGRK